MTTATTWPAEHGAPPLYATPRNHARPTDGPQVGVIAKHLGTPLLPWQQYVADVANERRPDGSFEYETVVVTVPRQTGKTTLLRAQGVHRAAVARRDVFYTAQTGKDARARWNDMLELLQVNDAFKRRIQVRLRGGSERVGFPGGKGFHAFAPTPESLHGYTPDCVFIDEAFHLTPTEGSLLMGAISPAQQTILAKQIWIVSTAGTAESTFLHDWIAVASEGAPRVAGFVWGASEDHDPMNPEHIAQYHPGVGFRLNEKVLTAADILEEAPPKNSRAEYERAFANRRTLTAGHLIPVESWRALVPEGGVKPPTSGLVLTYAVAHDRQSAAIGGTWLVDGRPTTTTIKAGPGMGWLAGEVRALKASLNPRTVGAVDSGPVLEVTDDLERGGMTITRLKERDWAMATTGFLNLIDAGPAALAHDGDQVLARSVSGLATRPAVTDGVAFSLRHSAGDASPAFASVAGVQLVRTVRTGKPLLDF